MCRRNNRFALCPCAKIRHKCSNNRRPTDPPPMRQMSDPFPVACVVSWNLNSKVNWCMFVRPSLHMRREEIPTRCHWWFVALMICSTCFGHFYAHHQELETICVLLPPMVCRAWLLVVGGQVKGSRLYVQKEGCCTTESCNIPLSGRLLSCIWPPTTRNQALHTIGGNNTHIVSSSWWWA